MKKIITLIALCSFSVMHTMQDNSRGKSKSESKNSQQQQNNNNQLQLPHQGRRTSQSNPPSSPKPHCTWIGSQPHD